MTVEVATSDGLCVVTLRRPPVNAVNLALVGELSRIAQQVREDVHCAAMVLTGTPGVFCAGVDTREVPAYDGAQRAAMLRGINRTVLMLYGMPKPVVAAISGHALGAGLVLALIGDLRLAARGPFKLGLTEVEAGIPFPAAPLAVVQAEVPADRARILALTGVVAEPTSPLLTGIVDEVVEPAALMEHAARQARALAAKPAFAAVKMQLRRATVERLQRIVDNDDEPLLRGWI